MTGLAPPAPRSRRAGGAVVASVALAALALGGVARAAPPAPAEVTALCADAEDASHCGRLVESRQLARLPGLAVRSGDELRVALYPSGTVTFRDEVRISGAQTYALWDALDRVNGVVLFTTDGDRSAFLFLLRGTGRQYRLPAEPVLSPDRQQIVTVDFCAAGCDNEVALWRVSREALRKERVMRPAAPWADATATWQGNDRLSVEFHRAGTEAPQQLDLALGDPRWQVAP